ncbi:MAG TPA: ATP-binding protein [Pyrinomonadaceae bacterium]|nr:ATP-binding protein [Pyrinomonadaceae bacterium]
MDQIDDKSLELERLPHSKTKLDQKASKRARDELEQQVNERTTQLSAINTQLINEIAERERAEIELTLVKDELAADLKTMLRLHELSTRLLKSTELQPLLEEILDATIELLNADFGNVQLCNPQSKALEIVAQRGFKPGFLDHFADASQESRLCDRAMSQRARVIIDDVETDPHFAPHRQIAASVGFRAVQATPLFSRNGEPLGILATHFRQPHHSSEHDLRFLDLYAHLAAEFIERKRAEERLRRNEIYLEEGQRLSHTGSWAWNVSTGEVYWSTEMFRIFDLDPDIVKPGYPDVLQYVHGEDRVRVKKTFEDAVREKKEYELAYRIVWSNGTIRYIHNLAHPVFDGNGTLIEYVGTTIDTTERIQAEEAALKAHQQIDMILESISDNFFGLDKEGRFTYFNPHAANQMRALGRDPDALIGRVAWEEFPDMPNKENVLRALSERVVVVDELYYAPLEEWVENHMYPSNDGGLVTFQRYITERKRTEEELRKTQDELAHVTRVTTLGELTASIAHEVNQPLGAIVTNGQACLRLLSSNDLHIKEVREAVECMIADGIRASEVIKRIRRLLKKSKGGKSSYSINDNIREVLALTASELTRNRINVRTELADDLPCVIADRVQIQQVVLNLVLNSKEAMSAACWQPCELLISTEHAESAIVVTITDTGVGIAPENRERIFAPFFTSKEEGLGLGLSISRTIIESHGGRLWSKPTQNGQGTTFKFTLPLGEDR